MTLEASSQDPGAGAPDLSPVARFVERAVEEQRLVGALVLINQDGKPLLRKAAGLADRKSGRPVREDTIFRLSSLTKPIVTAAALSLIERRALGLNDLLSRWVPELRPKLMDGSEPEITIRQLLTHTAGFTYGLMHPGGGAYAAAGVSDGLDQPGLTIDEELRRLANAPLTYRPGSSWGYSLAIDVLGEVLARAGGAPLPRIVEDLVAAPLGMTDTAFAVRDADRLGVPYVDGAPPRLMRDSDAVPFADGDIKFAPSRIFDARSYPSGGAGMAGTGPEFLRFLEAVRQGGAPILSPASARAMMSNQIGDLRINVEPTSSWGFGFGGAILMDPKLAATPQAVGTWKWGGVYGHHWFVDPVNRLTVVALSNTALEGFAGGYAEGLRAAVYSAIGT